MAASCRNKLYDQRPVRGVRVRAFVFLAGFALALTACGTFAHAATGDGKIIYGEQGTGIIRSRDYTNSSNSFGSEGNATTTATTVTYAVIEASPQADEYIAATFTDAADDTLYVSYHTNSAWNLDITQTGIRNAATNRGFDAAFEQGSGNALVVYSNGSTASDQLSYYYRNCDVNGGAGSCEWIGPCTLTVTGASAAMEWIELASRPSSDEIALAASDTADNLYAAVWNPQAEALATTNCTEIDSWWNDQSGDITGGNSLSGNNMRKFDVEYEQSSGDILVAGYRGTNTQILYATNPGSATGWTITSSTNPTNNAGFTDLCARPSSDDIALVSATLNGTSADIEHTVWTGGTNSFGTFTEGDATAQSVAGGFPAACAWVGTSGNAIAVYSDNETDAQLDWVRYDAGSWTLQTDVTHGATNSTERNIFLQTFPGENKVIGTATTTATSTYGDAWTFRYDNTSLTVHDLDGGTAGNQPVAVQVPVVATGPAYIALTAHSPTPVAEILTMTAQKDFDAVRLAWNTKTESRINGYHITRALKEPGKAEAELAYERLTKKVIPSAGGPMAGHDYAFTDSNIDPDAQYAYRVEVIGKGGRRVTQATPPISPDLGGRVTYMDVKSGKVETASVDSPMEAESRITRTGEKVRLTEAEDGVAESSASAKPAAAVVIAASGAAAAKRAAAAKKAQSQAAQAAGEKKTAAAQPQVVQPVQAAQANKRDEQAAIVAKSAEPAVKLRVTDFGVYRVNGSELSAAGFDLASVKPQRLILMANGVAIPIRLIGMKDGAFDADDAVEFVGEPVESRFYKENVYWLTQADGGGPRMEERPDPRVRGFDVRAADHKVFVDGNAAYYAESPSDAHWFFETELFSGETLEVVLTVDYPHFGRDKARLVVGLQGLSSFGYGDSLHNRQHAVFSLNGKAIGEREWEGDVYARVELDVPMRLLVEGDNTLSVESADEGGALEQFFLVDFAELTYDRKLVASDKGLAFAGRKTAGRVNYEVRRFPESQALAWLLRRDGTVEFLTDVPVESDSEGFVAVVSDNRKEFREHELVADEDEGLVDGNGRHRRKARRAKSHDRFVVIPPSAVKPVEKPVLDAPSSLRSGSLKPYLVIAPAVFHEALKHFVSHRGGMLVDLQDVYDEYAVGLAEPSAIRDFLISASGRGVNAALLVGDGHFDFRNFQQSNAPQLMPPALVSGKYGETVSDSWFATAEGELVPRLAVGRFPVRSADELKAVIDKTLAYERRAALPASVFMADDEPVFRSTHDKLAQLLPYPDSVARINYGEYDAADAKRMFMEAVNGGAALASYVGHGGIQLWSAAHLFANDDVALLENADRYPVLLVLGCLSGYFATPQGMDSLAEVMLLAPEKGIAAALSPTGLTSTVEQQVLGETWLKQLVEQKATLGEALLQAQRAVARQVAVDKARAVIQTFSLLGDPALKLKLE